MNPFFMQLAAPSGLRLWFLNYEKIWLEIKRGVSLRLSFFGSIFKWIHDRFFDLGALLRGSNSVDFVLEASKSVYCINPKYIIPSF
jgi:hypothetical protein